MAQLHVEASSRKAGGSCLGIVHAELMAHTHKAPLIGGLHLSHHRHAAAQGFRIDAVLLQALAQLMLNGDVGGLLAIEAHHNQIQLIDQ